jgi:gliding motility-associated-like protein
MQTNIKHIFISLLLISSTISFAQLTTNTGINPQALVQNTLIGPGVTVSNITFNGSPSSIGSFSGTGTNLGIANGIVMTTGTVIDNGSGPHGPNNQAGAGQTNGSAGSTLLSGIIGGEQTYDAAILEFDFIPYSDTVRFKYVFGSDEYPEFAPPNNSGYNDVFGFFIAGPGITGLQNIARLPNNGSIVSINNVNAITNPSFFNFNGDGTSSPYNSSPFYIQYDGFTDVLEAVSSVQCGETYHLILALADVGDGQWDSGIFLEANSLTSKTPVDLDYTISQSLFSNPDWIAEGCVNATVTLSRQTNLSTPLTIPIQITGTAINGLDFSGVPASILFAPGQSSVSFTITSLYDNLVEGLETISLVFPLVDPCGNVTPLILDLFIQDIPPLTVQINATTINCPGENVVLTTSISGGLAPISYLWNTGAQTPTINFTPTVSASYSVEVSGTCSNQPSSANIMVTVPVFQPLTISVNNDITEICPYIPVLLDITPTGGSGIYTFEWLENTTQISSLDTVTVSPALSTSFVATVTDNCGSVASETVIYTISSPPLIVTTSPAIEICPGDSAFISASASGGYGNYYYLWPHNNTTLDSLWVYPSVTTNYVVNVSDECQTFSVPSIATVIVIEPNANFEISSNTLMIGLPIAFQNTSTNASFYSWSFGEGTTSSLVNPINTYYLDSTYYITLIATDNKGCTDTITKPITIKEELYIYIPNTFTPDDDEHNCYFYGSFIGLKSLEVSIYNRWGELIFEAADLNFEWDGKYGNTDVQSGAYSWRINYVTIKGQSETISGHVNVIR